MRIGFMSQYNPERIAFARDNGFGCVELLTPLDGDWDFLPGHDGWQDRAQAVKAAYEQANLRISCVGGFYINHMDPNPEIARRFYEHTRNVMTFAQHIGTGVVAGFTGRILNEELEKSLPLFQKIWSEHAKFAEDHGVRIAFEHCPMGRHHTPFGGNNAICTPAMWERCFESVPSSAIGLEWDPSHLIAQCIDPLSNIRRYASKIFHVHAKDAKVYSDVLRQYGLYHDGAIEHCFCGLGDTPWPLIIKELYRAGYTNDLNIEGWHDRVYRNHDDGHRLEDQGLLIAKRYLEPYVARI